MFISQNRSEHEQWIWMAMFSSSMNQIVKQVTTTSLLPLEPTLENL